MSTSKARITEMIITLKGKSETLNVYRNIRSHSNQENTKTHFICLDLYFKATFQLEMLTLREIKRTCHCLKNKDAQTLPEAHLILKPEAMSKPVNLPHSTGKRRELSGQCWDTQGHLKVGLVCV